MTGRLPENDPLRLPLAALLASLAFPVAAAELPAGRFPADPALEARIDALLQKMTLDEKIGQMRQGGWAPDFNLDEAKNGVIGSLTNAEDPHAIATIQKAARASRLGIPLLFTHNVIHGFRTLFPVPLGLAATFDPALVEEASQWAGRESAAAGLHWTLGPMVDLTRDPRWGRVVEGLGEDPFLASQMSAAQVKGLAKGGITVSLKHYVGYGAAEAGRDYNSTYIPTAELHDLYLPPFKAGVEAGAQTVMAAFNALNGLPATANPKTLDGILKQDWGFDGFVISDWDSIMELKLHGIAGSDAEAARLAANAGIDVEMAGDMFKNSLKDELAAGRVSQARVDDAVRRVLRVKFRLGLFDKPDADPDKAAAQMVTPEARAAARKIATDSLILLKNDRDMLPLKPAAKLAVIGAIADEPGDHMGSWGAAGRREDTVTTLQALKTALPGTEISYHPGCDDACTKDIDFVGAVKTAMSADVIVAVLGEPWYMTAEGTSRTKLGLPNRQQELLDRLIATGKPVVLVVIAGRPMAISEAAEHVPAILYAFSPGTEGGNAIADVLTGKASPAGKLPMTMPRSVGQIPIYYSRLPTGRPATADHYSSKYIDEAVGPLYPFGYGLSYGRFVYNGLTVETPKIAKSGTVAVSVTVKNDGAHAGREAVQLYTHDRVASLSRPIRELKAITKIDLTPGETKRVRLEVPVASLGFHLDDGRYVVEPGTFDVYVGGSSEATLAGTFEVTE
jgi:beta-glucosidase